MVTAENVWNGAGEISPVHSMGPDPILPSSEEGMAFGRGRKRSHGLFGALGHIFHKQKKYLPDQLEHYLDLVEKYPQNATYLLKLADIFLEKGEEEKAISNYLQAAEIFSSDQFYPQAMAIYKQTLLLNPHLVRANLKMAEIYRQMGLLADALDQYRIVIKHYEYWGKKEKIQEIAELIHELESQKYSMAKKVQGLSGRTTRTPEPRNESIPYAASKAPAPEIINKGDGCPVEENEFFFDLKAQLAASEPMESKDVKEVSTDKIFGFEEIYKELQETAISSDTYPDFNYHMGLACREMGFNDGAIEQFQLAVENGQNPLESAMLLSKCYREKGWLNEAQKVFEQAMEMKSDSREQAPELEGELVLVHI